MAAAPPARALSEDSSAKPARGRPRLVPPGLERIYRDGRAGLTPRTVASRHYEIRAFAVLGLGDLDAQDPDPTYLWLCDPRRQHPPGVVYRKSILTELGRIPDDEDLRAVALRVCELKPKARAAIAMIRRWRRGEPEPRPGQLAGELIRTVNDHLARYPSATWREIRGAVGELFMAVDARAKQEMDA